MEPYALPKSEWPDYLLGHEQLEGIYINGCKFGCNTVNDKGTVFVRRPFLSTIFNTKSTKHLINPPHKDTNVAHAHPPFLGWSWRKSRRKWLTEMSKGSGGWICIPNRETLLSRNTMIHEVSHLISTGGHNKEWGDTHQKLGGHFRQDYIAHGQWGAGFKVDHTKKPNSWFYYKPY